MSNRTLVELNHDYCPRDGEVERWGLAMQLYMRSGNKEFLPLGVAFKHFRHHSEPDPLNSGLGVRAGQSIQTMCSADIGKMSVVNVAGASLPDEEKLAREIADEIHHNGWIPIPVNRSSDAVLSKVAAITKDVLLRRSLQPPPVPAGSEEGQ